jgi:ATP-dependent Lon protease
MTVTKEKKSVIENRLFEEERRRGKLISTNFKVTGNTIQTAQLNLTRSAGFRSLNVLIIGADEKVDLNLLEHKEGAQDLEQKKKRQSLMLLLGWQLARKARKHSVNSVRHICLLFHPKRIAVGEIVDFLFIN